MAGIHFPALVAVSGSEDDIGCLLHVYPLPHRIGGGSFQPARHLKYSSMPPDRLGLLALTTGVLYYWSYLTNVRFMAQGSPKTTMAVETVSRCMVTPGEARAEDHSRRVERSAMDVSNYQHDLLFVPGMHPVSDTGIAPSCFADHVRHNP